MPRKPISFELDFMIKDIFPRFTVKQFDDVSFNIKPLNQGLEYDTTGMTGKIFVGVNNDMFMQTTGITVSSDNINVLLDKNMLQKNGRAYAEIELTDEAGTITSSSFIFDIDAKIGEGGMIPGEYEGFVEKYERLISEFKAQINSSISNSNDLVDKTIKNCNTSVDSKLNTVDDRLNTKIREVDEKLDTVDTRFNSKISDFEKRFNRLTASQQQDAEVIEAREEEVSLKARLDRDIENPKKLYTSIEGTEISVDSLEGYLKDIEILGNTIQDTDNLADIRSVGDKLENQELYEIPVLCTNGLDSSDSSYQEQQITILSPVQLEKVGDVADRVICKDGVWGIEKNIGRHVLSSEDSFSSYSGDGNYVYASVKLHNQLLSSDVNRFIASLPLISTSHDSVTTPYYRQLCCWHQMGVYYVTPEAQNLNELLLDVDKVKPVIFYQLQTPQFIPLPYDQQVKLRTFANKTNIHFECEIEPTLKASVPKSVGASVNSHSEQIDNLSKEIEKINNLEESIVSTVTTESDFTTVENTNNGYFEDAKIEGKTLVNLADYNNSYIVHSAPVDGVYTKIDIDSDFNIMFKPTMAKINTKYTMILDVLECDDTFLSTAHTITHNGLDCSVEFIAMKLKKGVNLVLLETSDTFRDIFFHTQLKKGTCKIKIVILEGDHTQNPPEYFEGIKSVGQDVDEISVLSCNENLFDGVWVDKYISSAGVQQHPSYVGTDYIDVMASKTYTINCGIESIYYFDKSKNYIGSAEIPSAFYNLDSVTFTTPTNCRYITCRQFLSSSTVLSLEEINKLNIQIKQGNTADVFIKHRENKKRILYYNDETQTWEKPILRQWDSIEKHSDGKYYYHVRSEEIVLDGSENWSLRTDREFENSVALQLNDIIPKYEKDNANIITDKFNSSTSILTDDVEGIYLTKSSTALLRVNKSKLSTQDVEGFKQWLQANPTTIVYQLANEEVYECTNLDLITYTNETNFVVKSGVLNPKVTLKVKKGIGNVVTMLQNKVAMLEDLVNKLIQK